MLLWSVGLYKVGIVVVLLLVDFNKTFRTGLGEFWPDLISIGNILVIDFLSKEQPG